LRTSGLHAEADAEYYTGTVVIAAKTHLIIKSPHYIVIYIKEIIHKISDDAQCSYW
jgi:hypothetical protein